MSRAAHWTRDQTSKLVTAINRKATPEEAAIATGRTAQACIYKANNMRLALPSSSWSRASGSDKRPLRNGFNFADVAGSGSAAGLKARELSVSSEPSRLTLRRFSFETEG